MTEIACYICNEKIEIPVEFQHMSITCPKCGQLLKVPLDSNPIQTPKKAKQASSFRSLYRYMRKYAKSHVPGILMLLFLLILGFIVSFLPRYFLAIFILAIIIFLFIFSVTSPAKKTYEDISIEQLGYKNPVMVCPHCQNKGCARTKKVKRKKGISGGKAMAGILTGGVSLLATGLARKENLTQAHCESCGNTWDF